MASTQVTDYVGRGPAASMPVAPNVGSGALAIYYATDTTELSIWNGSAWIQVGGLTPTGVNTLLANITGGSAVPTGASLTAIIDHIIGNTQGNVLYRSASAWAALAPGTAGQVLATGGSAANPSWVAPGSGELRTLPFSIVGSPLGGQVMPITFTQAGTLLANGGAPQGYVGNNPAATQTLALETIHSGTVTTRGTISISTSGSITWPSYSAVPIAAGDTGALVNQGTADATFGNACFSLQFKVT